MRFTFHEFAALQTSRLPFSPATHTGVETGVPSRLKVVMLTYRSFARAAVSIRFSFPVTRKHVRRSRIIRQRQQADIREDTDPTIASLPSSTSPKDREPSEPRPKRAHRCVQPAAS